MELPELDFSTPPAPNGTTPTDVAPGNDVGPVDKGFIALMEQLARNPMYMRKYVADLYKLPIEQTRVNSDGKPEIRVGGKWQRASGYESETLTGLQDFAASVVAGAPHAFGSAVGGGLGFGAGAFTPVPGAALGLGMLGGGIGGTYGGKAADAIAELAYGKEALAGSDRSALGDFATGAASVPLGMGAAALTQRAGRHGLSSLVRPLKPIERVQSALSKSAAAPFGGAGTLEAMGLDDEVMRAAVPGYKPSLADVSPEIRTIMSHAGSRSSAAKDTLGKQIAQLEKQLGTVVTDASDNVLSPALTPGGPLSRRAGTVSIPELTAEVAKIAQRSPGMGESLTRAVRSQLPSPKLVTTEIPAIDGQAAMQVLKAHLDPGLPTDEVFAKVAAKGADTVSEALSRASKELGPQFDTLAIKPADGKMAYTSLENLLETGANGRPLVGESANAVRRILGAFPRGEAPGVEGTLPKASSDAISAARGAADSSEVAEMNVGQLHLIAQDIARLKREGFPSEVLSQAKRIIQDAMDDATDGQHSAARKKFSQLSGLGEETAELLGVAGKERVDPEALHKFLKNATPGEINDLKAILPKEVVDSALLAKSMQALGKANTLTGGAKNVVNAVAGSEEQRTILQNAMTPEKYSAFQQDIASLIAQSAKRTITEETPLAGNIAARDLRPAVKRAIGFDPKMGNIEALREAKAAFPRGDWDDFMREVVSQSVGFGSRSKDFLENAAYWREALGAKDFKRVLELADSMEKIDLTYGAAKAAKNSQPNAAAKNPLGFGAQAGDWVYRVFSNVGRAQWLENLSYEKYAADIVKAAMAPDGAKVLKSLKTYSPGKRASMAGVATAMIDQGMGRLSKPKAEESSEETKAELPDINF